MKSTHISQALLLRKVLLPNDDGILECFTAEFGRVSIFCSKLARSKQKIAEIDFFRLLEIEMIEGRSHYKLRSVRTRHCFSQFQADYDLMERGFAWLELIRSKTPEQKSDPMLFQNLIGVFGHVDRQNFEAFENFLRFKTLQGPNSIPRFDQIQDDVYFCPQNFVFSREQFSNSLYIKNLCRQILELLRRSDYRDFSQKIEKLPASEQREVSQVIDEIEKWH